MTAATLGLLHWIAKTHPTAWVNVELAPAAYLHGSRLKRLMRDGLVDLQRDPSSRHAIGGDRFARLTDAGRRVVGLS